MIEISKMLEKGLDSYYIIQSYEVSRSCQDEVFKVGCILVKDNKIISTGFNKIIDGDEYNLSIHAECDAIAKCARKGISTENSTLYCNLQPCPDCAKLIVASKIKKVVYGMNYSIRRYEIVDQESYYKRFDKKEPVLVKFSYENSEKIFEENDIELKYIDIYGLMYELEHQQEFDTAKLKSTNLSQEETSMEELGEDKIRELINIRNMSNKKICVQNIYSNDEVGYNCMIVVTDLHDNNDISDILYKTTKKNTKIVQDKMIGLLRITKDEKLRKELLEDIESLDEVGSMYEEGFGYNNDNENKCKFFILSIRPGQKVELRRMDTQEYIDIKGINGLFDVLKDGKYDFIY